MLSEKKKNVNTGPKPRCQMTVMKMAYPHLSVTAAMKPSENHKLLKSLLSSTTPYCLLRNLLEAMCFSAKVILMNWTAWSILSAQISGCGGDYQGNAGNINCSTMLFCEMSLFRTNKISYEWSRRQ